MRLGLGIGILALTLAIWTPASARASTVHLLDHALSAPYATAPADLQLHQVDLGGGAGAGMNPLIPAIASFLIPGLGQVINGQIGKGILFFVVEVALGVLSNTISGLFYILAVVGWVYNIYDAYTVAGGGGGDVEKPRGPAFRPPDVALGDRVAPQFASALPFAVATF